MDEIRVDMRKMTSDDMAMYAKHERLLFELNQLCQERRNI